MLRINNLRVSLQDDTPLEKLAAHRLKLPPQSISEVVVVRRALDARRKNNISFVYTIEVKTAVPEGQVLSRLKGDRDVSSQNGPQPETLEAGSRPLKSRPVIVGMGPAGLLAAYTLARYGYRPLVLERGRDVDRRTADIARFWTNGALDETSNVQFGEGGAGTFSDGKLTTRVNDPKMSEVLDIFVGAGAPPEIKYLHKPHVGTDRLREMVKNIRQQIIRLGGQVEFEARVTDIELDPITKAVKGLVINENRYIAADVVLLGIGHSARDTYEMLRNRQIAMEPKPFAIGVRIEHPQELIDRAQYGIAAGHPKLGAADYALVYQDRETGRAAYSFCMCPGGLVVAAASERGGVVTNGMSNFDRESGIANSALVVTVGPADYGHGLLDGIAFQRNYEHLAYLLGGANYQAPVQQVGDFLGTNAGGRPLTKATYRPGTKAADLHECLPSYVTATLARALNDFDRRIKGFAQPGAIMTGVETRTSAPLRILRGADFCAVETAGLYPIGEGAGYAGGIMSAALDGMNAAVNVIQTYSPI